MAWAIGVGQSEGSEPSRFGAPTLRRKPVAISRMHASKLALNVRPLPRGAGIGQARNTIRYADRRHSYNPSQLFYGWSLP